MTAEVSTNDMVQHESVKETIVSIIVALIMAFIFRAFIVEAFVIPTGSMAPTLYGAHGTIVCEDCGKEFAYGLKDLGDTRNASLVGPGVPAVCPNCAHPNTNLKINDRARNPETGDRILVLKWPFDLGIESLGPARWDVTVFKDPSDGTTNFIKRMVGLPNEVLSIIDGDVYTVPTSELSPRVLETLESLRHEKFLRRTGQRTDMLRRTPGFVLNELDRKLTIARKTPEAQEALWFLVYDHDYPPRDPDRDQPRWRARAGEDSGWRTGERRLRFEEQDIENDFVEIVGKQIRATNSYNVFTRLPPEVSDQRVRFVLTSLNGAGAVRIRLKRINRVFYASIGADGTLALSEKSDGKTLSGPIDLKKRMAPLEVGKPIEVSFENVDYRLALRVRGEEVLATSLDPTDAHYYGPFLKSIRKGPLRGRGFAATSPRLYAKGGAFELAHVVVERDEYYYHEGIHGVLNALPWAPKDGWASPESPILLREGEYFMLGDNTSASKDSRLWDVEGPHLVDAGEKFQLGTVPRDQLIGKAFFVYWPSPTRVSWLDWIPVLRGSVIPDVGRMRWIR